MLPSGSPSQVSFPVLAPLSCIGSVKHVCVARSPDSWTEAGGGKIEVMAYLLLLSKQTRPWVGILARFPGILMRVECQLCYNLP